MTGLNCYPTFHTVRTFDIEAISLPIVYDKYGDHDPNGLLYVLKNDSKRIQKRARENFALSPPQPYEEVRPLVIRANVGDEIHVNLYNKLDRAVSIHVQGLKFETSGTAGFASNHNAALHENATNVTETDRKAEKQTGKQEKELKKQTEKQEGDEAKAEHNTAEKKAHLDWKLSQGYITQEDYDAVIRHLNHV